MFSCALSEFKTLQALEQHPWTLPPASYLLVKSSATNCVTFLVFEPVFRRSILKLMTRRWRISSLYWVSLKWRYENLLRSWICQQTHICIRHLEELLVHITHEVVLHSSMNGKLYLSITCMDMAGCVWQAEASTPPASPPTGSHACKCFLSTCSRCCSYQQVALWPFLCDQCLLTYGHNISVSGCNSCTSVVLQHTWTRWGESEASISWAALAWAIYWLGPMIPFLSFFA